MKKITITLMTLLLGFGLMAQNLPYISGENTQNTNRDNEYVCLPTSVFSQVYSTAPNAYYGDSDYTYSRAADDFTATSSFNSIRFWGINYAGGPINTTETFVIKFYEPNTSDPNIPGTEVNSFTVLANPIDLGIIAINSPVYQVDINFGTTINLLDGWVSITRQNPGDGYRFAVMASTDVVGNEASYDNGTGTWLPNGSNANLLFCLGNTGSPAVPLSNWALVISLLLISAFIVVRFRTRIA